jgi:hypothetical protein
MIEVANCSNSLPAIGTAYSFDGHLLTREKNQM